MNQFSISIPKQQELSQDREFFLLEEGGEARKIRLQDYDKIFSVPGLYEQLLLESLEYASPKVMQNAFDFICKEYSVSTSNMSVLEIGPGNGVVGEMLRKVKVSYLVGIDISEIACTSAARDRPNVYDDYIVSDLSQQNIEKLSQIRAHGKFGFIVAVASLGFSDASIAVFQNSLSFLKPGGFVGICIKEEFLFLNNNTGFGDFLRVLCEQELFIEVFRERYVHRLSTAGQPIYYIALFLRGKT